MKKFPFAAVMLMALVALVTFTGCSTLFGDENKWTKVKDPEKELVGTWVCDMSAMMGDSLDGMEDAISEYFGIPVKVTASASITINYPKKGEKVTGTMGSTVTISSDTAFTPVQLEFLKPMVSSIGTVTVSTDNKSVSATNSEEHEYETAAEFFKDMGESTVIEINGKKNAFRVIEDNDEETAMVFKKSK